jgi:hypothetical protein
MHEALCRSAGTILEHADDGADHSADIGLGRRATASDGGIDGGTLRDAGSGHL